MAFYNIYIIWFLSEIFLNRLFRSGKNDLKKQDRGSLKKIWITIGLANTLGILAALYLRFPVTKSMVIPYSGLIILVAGMMLRFYSILSLGRYFTVDVTIRENHKLKQNGIYTKVRHPSYTGMLLSFLGFGLSLNNWFSLFIIVIPVTSAMLYRIGIEEKILSDQFGEEYSAYREKTWRLVPWIY